MKKFVSILLAVALCLSLCSTAFAAEDNTQNAIEEKIATILEFEENGRYEKATAEYVNLMLQFTKLIKDSKDVEKVQSFKLALRYLMHGCELCKDIGDDNYGFIYDMLERTAKALTAKLNGDEESTILDDILDLRHSDYFEVNILDFLDICEEYVDFFSRNEDYNNADKLAAALRDFYQEHANVYAEIVGEYSNTSSIISKSNNYVWIAIAAIAVISMVTVLVVKKRK